MKNVKWALYPTLVRVWLKAGLAAVVSAIDVIISDVVFKT